MKVITNTTLVENRAKWAKRIAPVTMLLLIGGLVTNFLSINNPDYFRPTLILLALGFISAIVSSHMVNNWVREPRADQILEQILKKFGNDYLLFNYTAPAPHVLVAPDAVYTFVIKSHEGEISVNGGKVSRKFTWKRVFRLFADEGLGLPVKDAENRAAKLQKYLHDKLNSQDVPEVKPVLLFSNKNVQLTVDRPDVPALQTNQLKEFLREGSKSRAISAEQRKQLADILAG
ncbi:MAG: hypothetical protein FOGNACKC_05706 [Anaerolineae bacterium]|nr:hypothetical protein [Anaerolineae bacterium]